MFILEAIDHGAHTFTEIRHDIGEANTKILTDRLCELVEYQILSKKEGKYFLTPLGEKLIKKILAITTWWWQQKTSD